MNNIGFLFDLDGVIIDSESEYSRIWSQINHEFPSGIDNLELVIKGTTLDNILNEHYPSEPVRSQVESRLHELENKMEYKYLPGAFRFLKDLKESNLKIALVTSSDDMKMEHLKEEIPDLTTLFDFIVTARHVTRSKPDPQGYLLAASKLGVKAENCAVFEDSLQGVTAGNNAGAYVIGIRGTVSEESLKPFCDSIVTRLDEIAIDKLVDILSSR